MRTLIVVGGTLMLLWRPALATAQSSSLPQTQVFIGGTHAEASQLPHQFVSTTEDGVEISSADTSRVGSRFRAT